MTSHSPSLPTTTTTTTFSSSSSQVNIWHGFRAVGFRKAAGLTAPNIIADDAAITAATPSRKLQLLQNNCAQRAHANFLEAYPMYLTALLIAGVQSPVASAALGAGWIVGRVAYMYGYTSSADRNGRGRSTGYLISSLAFLGLWGLTGYTGFKLVTA